MVTNFPFDSLPTTGRFHPEHAFFLARAAAAVYQPGEQIRQLVVDQWGEQEFEFFDEQDTQAFVSANSQFITVSFRGTEQGSLRDWMTDADTDLVTGPLNGKVHGGFYDALANVWQLLDRFVWSLQKRHPRKILVTGHSLGAALATLSVARWLGAGIPVHGLYTFGQPRTGDETFARNFNFEFKPSTFRFVNNNDLVTRIPPRSFGYSHLGTFRYFTADGTYAEQIDWWRRFLDSWKGRLEDVFSAVDDGIQDHSMIEYCRLVESLLEPEAVIPFGVGHQALERFFGPFLVDRTGTARAA